jgi:hypothetical protein
VSARDFKSCGSAFGGPVGSIPTHFRHCFWLIIQNIAAFEFVAGHGFAKTSPEKAVQSLEGSQAPGPAADWLAAALSGPQE